MCTRGNKTRLLLSNIMKQLLQAKDCSSSPSRADDAVRDRVIWICKFVVMVTDRADARKNNHWSFTKSIVLKFSFRIYLAVGDNLVFFLYINTYLFRFVKMI